MERSYIFHGRPAADEEDLGVDCPAGVSVEYRFRAVTLGQLLLAFEAFLSAEGFAVGPGQLAVARDRDE